MEMARHFNTGGLNGAFTAGIVGLVLSFGAGATTVQAAHAPCFSITQWHGWKAPSPDVLYLRVGQHDVYKADLSAGSTQLQWPDAHLSSRTHGQDSVCSPSDLQLYVADINGNGEPLVVSKLTRLTPQEVAAIPEQFRPH
jgi:hypothetical protein